MASLFTMPRWLTWALLLAALAQLAPVVAAAQALRAPPKQARARIAAPYGGGSPQLLPSPAAVVTVMESEPNDSIRISDTVVLGDTIAGTVDPIGDVDFFAFEAPAGTRLVLDVDAAQVGSVLDPILALFDVDGATTLAFSDDWDGLDSRIEYTIPSTGRYYAGIMDYGGAGGIGYFYSLAIIATVAPPPGPGDSTRLFASGIAYPMGMTAGRNGELFVADWGSSTLVRVGTGGAVSTFASPVWNAMDVTLDGYGDLLVAAGDSGVWRVTSAGTVSRFLNGFMARAIAVDEGGNVWVAGQGGSGLEIRRLDARGALEFTFDANVMGGVFDLAFSPSGELYASNGYDGVFRLTGGIPELVISAAPYLEGLAFDQDGYLYVANGVLGEVSLYDPSFHPVSTPFARTHLGGPINLVFGRTSDGVMTSRLFAANGGYNLAPPFAGGIVEMNPAGMRAPGFLVGVTRPVVALRDVADAFLGKPGAVSAEVEEFLDLQGNGNGRLDVADFRAYLRTTTQPAASAGRVQP